MNETGPSLKPMIGLIGGIGAGKSTVAGRFAELGACVIDADKVGHEVLDVPPIQARIVERFGAKVLGTDGKVDRRRLGAAVFSDTQARKDLEAIVHPAMRDLFVERIGKAMLDPAIPLIVLDAAVLLEAGWGDVCGKIVFVDASRPARMARLLANRGWTEEELARREAAQLPLDEKRRRADVVLANEGDPGLARAQVDQWFREWVADVPSGTVAQG